VHGGADEKLELPAKLYSLAGTLGSQWWVDHVPNADIRKGLCMPYKGDVLLTANARFVQKYREASRASERRDFCKLKRNKRNRFRHVWRDCSYNFNYMTKEQLKKRFANARM